MDRSKGLSVAGVATGLMVGALLGAVPAGAASDQCVAVNGAGRTQKGTATCEASGTGSVAIAKGAASSATATGGDHNTAMALADNSAAVIVDGGNNNTAIASAEGSQAFAGGGDNNTATASGVGSQVDRAGFRGDRVIWWG